MLSKHHRTTWLFIRHWMAANWKFVAGSLAFLVFAAAVSLNQPLSRSEKSCRFLRWTTQQNYTGNLRPRVFCDLADGRTILARAPQNWLPPPPSSIIPIEEQKLLFGTNYEVKQR